MDDEENLRSSVAYAIGLTSLRPRSRNASDNDEAKSIAAIKIIEHLRLCGWRFWKKPPDPPHSAGGRSPQ